MEFTGGMTFLGGMTVTRQPPSYLAYAIFGYGYSGGGATQYSLTNLVSNTGVVATDTAGVGTARNSLAAAGYGSDKAIFGYGTAVYPTLLSMTNLVSNTGVVATDTATVVAGRFQLAAASFSSTV